jgi:hypothetical protein
MARVGERRRPGTASAEPDRQQPAHEATTTDPAVAGSGGWQVFGLAGTAGANADLLLAVASQTLGVQCL